jgi:hypothetical protein
LVPDHIATPDSTGGGSKGPARSAAPSGDGDPCVTDVWSFAPRKEGVVNITTSLTGYAPSERTSEIIVEGRYVGAIRVGVAGVVPFGQNPAGPGISTYGIHSSPAGGNQIYKDSWTLADLELVAGYTAFLSPRRLTKMSQVGLGWFGGIGILSVSPASGNVNALNSVYTGLELSAGGFQAMFLGGFRRETELSSGYKVGDHAPAGASITSTAVLPVAAVMIGFTSDAFKIAMSGIK